MKRGFGAIISVATLSLSVSSAHGGSVSGIVRESGSQCPIADARVTVFEPTLQFFQEMRTDALGQYAFSNVPSDDPLQLGASSLGREYFQTEITIAGSSFEQDFLLDLESHPGEWNVVGNTLPEFFDATDIGILRPDGKIFYCHDTVDPILFDATTGEKSYLIGSWSEQGCMNATLRSDGSMLMIGGQDGSDPGSFTDTIPWVKRYIPQSNTWSNPPDLQHAAGRWYPGLSRLADGSLLVMGGGTAPSAARTDTCERMDDATLQWSYTGSMLNPTEFPPSALLFSGEVLATWWPPQRYNPTTGQWRLTDNFNQPNRLWPGHSDHSIVVLEDGRVLAIGINGAAGGNTVMGEIYDPTTETWSLTSNPDLVRFQTEVVPLPDGRILVAAGETEELNPPVPDVLGIVEWCDLYDPSSNTWRHVADLNWHREYHAVTLLVPDGRVLTTGGTRIKFQFGPTSADIEAFSPPYLFRGVRPEIADISATEFARGCPINLEITPDTQITSVVLIGTGVTTHWVDAGVMRRLVLPPQQVGSTVTVTLPEDENIIPLGHYMLFAMVDDIPSVAKIIRISGSAPIPGDMNMDGGADLIDLPLFVGALLTPTSQGVCAFTLADVNQDDEIDGLDVTPFVELLLVP